MSEIEQKSSTPVLIVLCGLVGSGKSTFASALQQEFPEFRRCNQDELGRRGDVEREVHAALSQGSSVCVDRTNIDQSQRRTWIDIAQQYPGVEVWGVQMDTPYEICRERLAQRIDHPTIKTPEQALHVLSLFAKDLVPIDPSEGFNRVFRLPPHSFHEYSREDIMEILAAIRATHFFDAPPPTSLPATSAPAHFSRGRGYYSNRGRGWNHNDGHSRGSGWRSSTSTTGSHNGGTIPTPGAWAPSPNPDGWRNSDSRGRGFRGNYRRPFRGAELQGRGGGAYVPSDHSGTSRVVPPPNRSRGRVRGSNVGVSRGGARHPFHDSPNDRGFPGTEDTRITSPSATGFNVEGEQTGPDGP